MLAALAAALSIAAIEVPFVPQTDALCGGAAAAMVFRYWGDNAADARQFASLIERRPGGVVGIAADVLDAAVRERGWRTEQLVTSDNPLDAVRALRLRLDARQPIIVLLSDRRDRYHYVVVTGWSDDAVLVHDPSWGPSRKVRAGAFARLWAASRFWSLAILPPENGVRPSAPPANSPTAAAALIDPCDAALNAAVSEVRARGVNAADSVLAPVMSRCPDSAGPLREMAGVRFRQQRWRDASNYAAKAIDRDANDEHALFLLGASLFLQADSTAALRAWNRIGRPKLDLVRIEGLRHSRYQTIAEVLGLQSNTILSADAFTRAKRRLNELPDRSSARMDVRPQEDGRVSVDVAIAERALPGGALEWMGTAVRAAVDREISATVPGFTGQGETWSASWRWWDNRPRVAIGFAAPKVGELPGVWRVEGSWEAETFSLSGASQRREERTHAGLTVSDWLSGNVRYALTAGFDAWSTARRAAALGASLERRWFDDRLSAVGNATTWFPIRDDASAGQFSRLGGRLTMRSSHRARTWTIESTVGADRVGDAAPMQLWPGAGEGRARPPLLRAHPLLEDGVIDAAAGSAFGRSLAYATVEGQRWFSRPALVPLGAAAFIDVARASRQAVPGSRVAQTDVGFGVRLRIPGTGRLMRIDAAHGLRDGNDAITVGWSLFDVSSR